MNELLNRWRHGEVNLLQRRFRLARAQSVKPTIAAKLLGGFAPPSASATTSTLAATSTTTTNNDNLGGTSFGDDGSTSPASGEDASVGGGEQRKSAGEGAIVGGLRGGAGSVETGESGGGTVGGGSSRAGMDKEAYLRVFPDVQVRVSRGLRRRGLFCVASGAGGVLLSLVFSTCRIFFSPSCDPPVRIAVGESPYITFVQCGNADADVHVKCRLRIVDERGCCSDAISSSRSSS